MTAEQKIKAQPAGDWYASAMERLVDVVQDLSRARTLPQLMEIVRIAARDLTGADGATFVLRDEGFCYYAEENAVSPLWKGKRFPLQTCVSGWVMLNREPAVIEDIYKDARIPVAAYKPTFVKSLLMVPIRKEDPIGAIGNYWARIRMPSNEEVAILQALANVTAVALENIGLYAKLQEKVQALEARNQELTLFSWIASHDLRSPLRGISHLSQWAEDDAEVPLSGNSRAHLAKLRERVKRMDKMLDDLLEYSLIDAGEKPRAAETAGVRAIVEAAGEAIDLPPGISLRVSANLPDLQMPRLAMERVFANLFDNAAKHHDRKEGSIEVSVTEEEGQYVFHVKDDGPGVPAAYQQRVFEMFQTLKPRDEREGSGMGLAIIRKILARQGSVISVESEGRGATFSFTWPKPIDAPVVSGKA